MSSSMEIRLHGRGGQGGVTCAKILAAVYARQGRSVQTFGDYAGERSGAPVRAYTRVSDAPITNRNKVYHPDHLLVLDPGLMGPDVLAGMRPGGTLLLNTPRPPEDFRGQYEDFVLATVDASAIARAHHIGSRSVVIVNTTIAGAFARLHDIPLDELRATYEMLGFLSNFDAAREAFAAVRIRPCRPGVVSGPATADAPDAPGAPAPVLPLEDHVQSPPPGLKTGSWASSKPEYVEKLAPCNAWCPAGNDVVGFVQALATADGHPGHAARAAALLGRTSALAATCGRVCPAPCMEGCNRREYDGAVDIRSLERFVADATPVATREVTVNPDPRRIAIVGGGPAGLSAAYQLVRAGHLPTIFEGEAALGGVLRTGIPSYRLPREVLDAEVDAIVALGVEVQCGTVLTPADLRRLAEDYDAVILATGLQTLRELQVPGVDLAGIEQGIRFLHRVNLAGGVELAGHVMVLGGGNTAMDCARSALRAGADEVTIAYRRTRAEMPAIPEELEEALEEGVVIRERRQPVGFVGNGSDDDTRLSGIRLAEVELGESDETGRRRPIVTERVREHACDHVLLALGQSADLGFLPEGWELRGERVFAGDQPLNVFAAGDLATGDGTVTHAIGSGRRAADLALQGLGLPVEVFTRPDRHRAVPVTDLRLDHFARRAPVTVTHELPATRRTSMVEVNHPLPDAAEAHRCFSCGHCTECDTCLVYCPEGIIRRRAPGYEVDYTYCKGCGICVEECPRRAIEMSSPSP